MALHSIRVGGVREGSVEGGDCEEGSEWEFGLVFFKNKSNKK